MNNIKLRFDMSTSLRSFGKKKIKLKNKNIKFIKNEI